MDPKLGSMQLQMQNFKWPDALPDSTLLLYPGLKLTMQKHWRNYNQNYLNSKVDILKKSACGKAPAVI